MDTNNFVIENKLKFLGNTGDFNEQPIFTLTNSKSLTGENFINVSRVRSSKDESASGVFVAYISSSAGLFSATGKKDIYSESVTSYGQTAAGIDYTVTTLFQNDNRFDLVVDELGTTYLDVNLTGFGSLHVLNYFSNNCRPSSEQIPPVGTTAASLFLYYTFNREEEGMSLTGVQDRSGNSISASLKGGASGDGTSSSVTGWSFSPCDGGFRLDGKGYIESNTSTYFNVPSNSGTTYMLFSKLAATGNSCLFSTGSGSTSLVSLQDNAGTFQVKLGSSTFSGPTIDVGRWYHLTVTLDSTTASNSGAYLYINGNSASFSALTSFDSLNESRMIIGNDLDLVSSSFTGSVGLFRVWNRALTKSEIMQNYLSTIPCMKSANSIIIG